MANINFGNILFGGGGGGGTDDYTDLINKPKINGVTVNGDKTSPELGLAHAADVASINVDNLGNAHAISIDLDALPKVCGYPLIIITTGAPSVAPDFIGQFYIDTTNSKVYMATGVTDASSFKVLN